MTGRVFTRRSMVAGAGCGLALAGLEATGAQARSSRWRMPAEEHPHEATWMCFPASSTVWGSDLPAVQRTVARIALAISDFEPVRMLVRPSARSLASTLVGRGIELIDGPVDDLWARDTLPLFLLAADGRPALAAGRVRFNGWGGKQLHGGDARLAKHVAELLGIELIASGLTGEGGGIETDGAGSVLASRSSWVNRNRNPGRSESEIGRAITGLLGARRVLWIDGIAGSDITDGHVDTLARFASPGTIVCEATSYVEPGETWYEVARRTQRSLRAARTLAGQPYRIVRLTQPTTTRGSGDAFLSSYLNYYVCNGAVIVPTFGDRRADSRAAHTLASLHPGRQVVQLEIDAVAAGGGGIHCSTREQPRVS